MKKGNFQLLDKNKEFSQKVGVNFLIFITMVQKTKVFPNNCFLHQIK